ncbi:hypothetical protein OFM39_26305, partial [Escherichia coli]|nr:hypothetical protein [Escherichia coli]
FLVVLSCIDYPLFGRNIVSSESVVASRPLYSLLLTDVTIVVARLYLENRRAQEEEEEEKKIESASSTRAHLEYMWVVIGEGFVEAINEHVIVV